MTGAGIQHGTTAVLIGTIPGITVLGAMVGVMPGMTLGTIPGISAITAMVAGMILGTMATIGAIPIIGVVAVQYIIMVEVVAVAMPISARALSAEMVPPMAVTVMAVRCLATAVVGIV